MLTNTTLSGLIPAVVTPTTVSATVNSTVFKQLLDYVISNGSKGVLVVGGTGEYMSLSKLERIRAVEACCEFVDKRVPVIAGVLSPCLPDAIDEGKAFMAAGADAVLLVEPYYNKLTQDGIKAHYFEFSAALDCPTLLYDIPFRTGVCMSPETIAELAIANEKYIGIKLSNPDMADFGRTVDMVADRLSILTGEEHLFVDHMIAGAHGAIIASNNVVPQAWENIYQLLLAHRYDEARMAHRELIPLIDTAFSSANPGPLKAVLPRLGIQAGPLLPPLPAPDDATVNQLASLVKTYVPRPPVD